MGTAAIADLGCEIFIQLEQKPPEPGVTQKGMGRWRRLPDLRRLGDNLLGELFASSLRGFYPFPSRNVNKNPPLPLAYCAHAELGKCDESIFQFPDRLLQLIC